MPRSKLKVTWVTRQPSFSRPTSPLAGTRTSSRNSSANSGRAFDRGQRPDLDPREVHRHDEPADPSALRGVGIGAHQQLAEVGDGRARRPDLLAGDHVLVAVEHRARAQAGEIATRLGLGEPLAPDLVAAEDGGQMGGALRVGSLHDERRARVRLPDEVDPDVGGAGPARLLQEDQLLGGGGAPAAELARPVDPGVPGVEQRALPAGVVLAPRRPLVGAGLGREIGHRVGQPATHLVAKVPVRLRVAQIQVSSLAHWVGPATPFSLDRLRPFARWRAPLVSLAH